MRGDTRFYSSPGRTVFCGHCDRKDCGRHYINKEKYPWRYYKGTGIIGLPGYEGCAYYESPEETKQIVERHLKRVKAESKIKILKNKIAKLEKYISELWISHPISHSRGLEGTKIDSGSHRMSDGFYESEFDRDNYR